VKRILILAAVILAAGAVAVLALVLLPGAPGRDGPDRPASAAAPAPAAEPPAAATVVPGAPGVAPGAPPTGPIVLPKVAYGPADPPPAAGSWDAVKPVGRPAALGPGGAAVGRELNELQPELSGCYDEVTQARHGQERITTTGASWDEAGAGPPTLMLQLELRDGEVLIVDAPVESRGGASDGLIACAQRILRGRVVPAPGARRGGRARVPFTLLE
jgi:hypothetical protein